MSMALAALVDGPDALKTGAFSRRGLAQMDGQHRAVAAVATASGHCRAVRCGASRVKGSTPGRRRA